MALFDFLFASEDGTTQTLADYLIELKAEKLSVKEFAINKAAGMIAKIVAKSEFQVITKGKAMEKQNKEMYYLLNIRPNHNEDGTTFWNRAAYKALTDTNGCLIINIQGSGIFIADSFQLGTSALNAKTVTSVVINGLSMNKAYSMNDCLLLKIGDNKIIDLLNSFYSEIGEMLGYAAQDFKVKNSKKWRISVPTSAPALVDKATGKTFTTQAYAEMIAKQLADSAGSVLSIPEEIKLDGLSGSEVKTSQDFRDLLKTALESAAMAYDIPIDIFTGQKTEKSTSMRDFITFAIDPVFEMIEDEINAKWLTKEEYMSGTKVKIDKLRIQHVDFFDTADAEIKLISAGYSHNDLRIAKGLEIIDEPWANERNIAGNNGKGGTNG